MTKSHKKVIINPNFSVGCEKRDEKSENFSEQKNPSIPSVACKDFFGRKNESPESGDRIPQSNWKIRVKTPGTCGELVQGMIRNAPFLVTCPINIFSHVTVSFSETKRGVRCDPPNKWKSKAAAEKVLELYEEKNRGIDLKINSDIPEGKGMGSSTADIIGSCAGTAKLLGKNISENEIAKIALSIEPSDGTMFENIVRFDYLKGSHVEPLGKAPKIKLLITDTGGVIDTIRFNKNDHRAAHSANAPAIIESLDLVREGFKNNDSSLIGKGATLSALCHQKILFKPELEPMIALAKKRGAFGVNIAHSGTVIGMLFDPDFDKMDALTKEIVRLSKRKLNFYAANVIGGGAISIS